MAQFNADIALNVQSNGSERQVRKLEAAVGRVERASQGILSIDKQILGERRKLLGLSGQQATRAKKRIADLRLQRSELALQRRELQGIVSLERRRAQAATTGGGDSGGGAGASTVFAVPLQQQRAARRARSISEAYDAASGDLQRKVKGINDLLAERQQIQDGLLASQQQLSQEIDESQRLNRQLNSVAASKDPEKTARLLLPDNTRISNKGLVELDKVNGRLEAQGASLEEIDIARKRIFERYALTAPQQIQKAEANQLQLERSIEATGQKIQQQERAYEGVNAEVRRLDGAERRRALNVQAALDNIDRREKAKAAARKRRQGIRTGAAAGLATANIPGQGLVQSGIAGAVLGGPAGAAAGVLTGLAVAAGNYGATIAKSTAETKKFEIALQGIAGNNTTAALARLNEINDKYNATNRATIQSFTQILAAGKAANIPLEAQLKTYEGLVVANKALGGSQDDLNGILRAATQIFSKNKVQAEELRGQIGDRLPGAFGQFAKSIGISTAELDQRLKDGQVSVADFVKFATSYLGPNSEWEKAAKNIGDSPEEAGARLERAIENLEKTLGPGLRRMGAQFQDWATGIVKWFDQVIKRFDDFATRLQGAEVNRLIQRRRELEADVANSTGIPRQLAQGRLNQAIKDANKAQKALNELRGTNKPAGTTAATDPPTPNTTQDELTDKNLRDLERLVERINAARTALADDSALLAIDRKIENAIRQGDRAAQITLQAERDTLAVRQNAAKELVGVTDERLKQAVLGKTEVEADRIALRAQTELLELDKQRTDEVNKQNQAWRQQGEELRAISTGALADIDKQIRTIKNQLTFGSDATFVDQIEDLVLNQGVPFSEAFGKVSELRAFNQELERTQYQTQQINQVVNGIGTEFAGLFQTVITGTEDLNKALADTLQSLSRILFQAGLNALGGNDGVGLFSILSGSFGGGRASGGPVTAGKSYVVGEKGPELFVPGRSGSIVPNGAASGVTLVNNNSIVVNNSGGELSPKAASQIARTVEAGTMAVLTRERRPGGLLTR